MRIVICWMGISGYLAACWRALAARDDVELSVIAIHRTHGDTAFDVGELSRGLDCRVLDEPEMHDEGLIASLVERARPDVLVVSGWAHPPYRRLVSDPRFAHVRKVMAIDTPWLATLRQHVGTRLKRGYVRKMAGVVVPGERSRQFARALGVPDARIYRGALGADLTPLLRLHEQRVALPGGWPRRFVYVGRYSAEKGVDVLVDAYRRYRQAVADPWGLTCVGKGPLQHLLQGVDGVEDVGFVQPRDLPEVLLRQGVFIMPSHYEAWGLAIVEAAAAGLPVLCTTACGASVEIVREYYNGLSVPTGDAGALARGMRWFHDAGDRVATIGRRGIEFAAAYSADAWAERWVQMFRAVTEAAPAGPVIRPSSAAAQPGPAVTR